MMRGLMWSFARPWNGGRWNDENGDREIVKNVCAILMRALNTMHFVARQVKKDFKLLDCDEKRADPLIDPGEISRRLHLVS